MIIARIFVGTTLGLGALAVLSVILLTATGIVGWQPTKQNVVRVVYAR